MNRCGRTIEEFADVCKFFDRSFTRRRIAIVARDDLVEETARSLGR